MKACKSTQIFAPSPLALSFVWCDLNNLAITHRARTGYACPTDGSSKGGSQ